MKTILVILMAGTAYSQVVEVDSFDGGPGLPKLSNIKLKWAPAQGFEPVEKRSAPIKTINELSASLSHSAPMPHGVRIYVTVSPKPGPSNHDYLCGTYLVTIRRPLPKTLQIESQVFPDTEYPQSMCTPGDLTFEFGTFEALAQEAADRRAQQAEEARRKAADLQRRATEAQTRARAVAACENLYATTASKRMGDLTVSEADLIQSCKSLGLFRAPSRQPTPPKPTNSANSKTL